MRMQFSPGEALVQVDPPVERSPVSVLKFDFMQAVVNLIIR